MEAKATQEVLEGTSELDAGLDLGALPDWARGLGSEVSRCMGWVCVFLEGYGCIRGSPQSRSRDVDRLLRYQLVIYTPQRQYN